MVTSVDPVVVVGGGQSGLVAARAVRLAGLDVVLLESRGGTAGSWPDYYDSLSVFSPARYSSLPGLAFPGDPDRYPHRDEVVEYLTEYASSVVEPLGVQIRTGTRVDRVEQRERGFEVHTSAGDVVPASAVVAATGSFANPYVPVIPGLEEFAGRWLHVADYRRPEGYAGQRVVVVGGGNSAIQVGYELAEHAEVTVATHEPVQFLAQRPNGRDVHYWTASTGFDTLPPAWLAQVAPGPLVSDDGTYADALARHRLDRRPTLSAVAGEEVVWGDGTREKVDVIVLATGYRASLDYLRDLGALDARGVPLHDGGLSRTHPGLVYLGLEFQRSFASNTLRGVGGDAAFVVPPLVAYATDAPAVIGL